MARREKDGFKGMSSKWVKLVIKTNSADAPLILAMVDFLVHGKISPLFDAAFMRRGMVHTLRESGDEDAARRAEIT